MDAGNGVAGPIVMGLAEKLPITVVPMFFEPDGSFPNHLPSPIEPENIADLQKRVVEENADLGMAFDGDADRVFLVDEKGGVVTGSEMTAMIIDSVLSHSPTATVLYNAVCGWNVRDVLAKYPNAKSYRTKVGHGYIKKDIREYDAEFAGEHSGHYFFKNNQGADSGLIAAVIVLQLLSSTESSVSEFLEKYRGYVQIPETNFRVADAKQVMEGLAEKYRDAKQDHLDGLTLYWDDAWASIRASSNEPLLRLNVEANTTERLDQLAAELANTIQQLGQASSGHVEG